MFSVPHKRPVLVKGGTEGDFVGCNLPQTNRHTNNENTVLSNPSSCATRTVNLPITQGHNVCCIPAESRRHDLEDVKDYEVVRPVRLHSVRRRHAEVLFIFSNDGDTFELPLPWSVTGK